MSAYYIGIDIGSTAAKTVVLSGDAVAEAFTLPTGWSGKETAGTIRRTLEEKGYLTGDHRCTATGYGRVCVDWADRVVTEITCHGKGGWALFGRDCTIIDVGGQDTKVITVAGAQVKDFLMNDKCAAGTGKFIEVMASRLGVSLAEFYALAEQGAPLAISAMCTVFAESEVISHIGAGHRPLRGGPGGPALRAPRHHRRCGPHRRALRQPVFHRHPLRGAGTACGLPPLRPLRRSPGRGHRRRREGLRRGAGVLAVKP